MLDYWDELKREDDPWELKPLRSAQVFFNTASIDVDEYIENELEEARRVKRNLSKNIAFCQSEKVLFEFANNTETKEVFEM